MAKRPPHWRPLSPVRAVPVVSEIAFPARPCGFDNCRAESVLEHVEVVRTIYNRSELRPGRLLHQQSMTGRIDPGEAVVNGAVRLRVRVERRGDVPAPELGSVGLRGGGCRQGNRKAKADKHRSKDFHLAFSMGLG